MANDEPDSVKSSTLSDSICLISLNRPHRRNAVNTTTARKLYEAFLAFENNPALKVCVFHGENGTFCAGADLHEVSTMQQSDGLRADMQKPVEEHSIAPMGPSRMIVKKPVIAAVSGHAVAGGLELSLIADMRVVEEGAIFGVFCRRWGVPLIDGGTVRLQKIVGFGRAMDMVLTGRPVGAQEALQMGLANRVVANGKSVEEAVKIAKQLVAFPQLCMNIDRASAYYAAYEARSFEDAMSNEFEKGKVVVLQEGRAGAARFKEGAGRGGSFDDSRGVKI